MSDRVQHVLIGLPETGKTTYLAALWHVLCSQEVAGSLVNVRLQGDQGYLNSIRERWSKVETLDRTTPGSEPHVSMILADENGKNEFEVCIPDLSGESFESDVIYRKMEQQRADLLSSVHGAIVFIHPGQVRKEVLICEVMDAADELDDSAGKSEEDLDDSVEEWNPQQAPTQVQLVELLQFLGRLNSHRPLRLAIAISAWDLVQGTSKPARWVERQLPLLSQFIRANDTVFEAEYYGVSAQGGDLDENSQQLKDHVHPSERIVVVDAKGERSNDVTLPLRWLMQMTE